MPQRVPPEVKARSAEEVRSYLASVRPDIKVAHYRDAANVVLECNGVRKSYSQTTILTIKPHNLFATYQKP